MKQLFLFDALPASTSAQPVTYWKLSIDGASRNNPGVAGAGIYIAKNGTTFEQHGYYLGTKTSNQAEYLALLIGIYYLKKHVAADEPVQILSDSQLLVRQIDGQYRVKHPELKPLHTFAQHMLATFNYDIAHVMREENSQADALANKGIDKKIHLPAPIADWLHAHGITL